MPLKITSRWLELDPSVTDALTADKIYYSSGETIADKISENNTQTTLSSPNIDSSVYDGDFVYIGSDGKYYPALADGTDKQNVVGMYDADNDIIVTTGVVEVSINANYGDWVYLSETNAGKLQTSETSVKIGLSLGNNKVLLAISGGIGGNLAGDYTFQGNVSIQGDLTVSGTTTEIDTETLTVEDNIILLNSNVTGSPTENAGVEVKRGSEPNVKLLWNEANDEWEVTEDGSNYHKIWHAGNDGSGSGLDADKLDGHDASYFAPSSHNHDSRYVKLSDYEDSDVLAKIKNVDGSGSGLDADKLDGQEGSFYRNASNLNTGTVPTARLSGTYNISISGNAATATNADKWDGGHKHISTADPSGGSDGDVWFKYS